MSRVTFRLFESHGPVDVVVFGPPNPVPWAAASQLVPATSLERVVSQPALWLLATFLGLRQAPASLQIWDSRSQLPWPGARASSSRPRLCQLTAVALVEDGADGAGSLRRGPAHGSWPFLPVHWGGLLESTRAAGGALQEEPRDLVGLGQPVLCTHSQLV